MDRIRLQASPLTSLRRFLHTIEVWENNFSQCSFNWFSNRSATWRKRGDLRRISHRRARVCTICSERKSSCECVTTQLLKSSQKFCSQIRVNGACLFCTQEARSVVIARNLEISEVERGLGNSIKAVENEIKKTLMSIDNVASDEANLEAKIEKRKQELERNQKRLMTLQSVRSVQNIAIP